MSNETPLGFTPGRPQAGKRLVDGLVRFLGGGQITVRIADPSSGSTSSQLGLEPSPAEDLQISPAVVQGLAPAADGARRIEVLLSATTIKPIARDHGIEDIVAWLRGAEGLLYRDHSMHIDAVTVDKVLGEDCLYHIVATE